MEFIKSNVGTEWMDLVEEFPEIFLQISPEVLAWCDYLDNFSSVPIDRSTVVNLRFGFECDIGWKEIIREFCTKVRELVNRAKENGHEIHHSTYILKEKFGSLRNQGSFYGPDRDVYLEEFYKLDNELENKSLKTCELTGKPGKLVYRNGWCKTLCEEMAEKLGYTWK